MKKAITILISLFSVCLFALLFARVSNAAKLISKESSQQALAAEIVTLLEDHYAAKNHYPESLRELKLTFPDGGSPELLTDFIYKTSGDSYSLVFTRVYSRDVFLAQNDHSQKAPNHAPEPTAMAVTPPAAQEPRQP